MVVFFCWFWCFFGFWVIYWKFEDGYVVSVGYFVVYMLILMVFFVVVYFIFDLIVFEEFILIRWEIGVFGMVVVFFVFFMFIVVFFLFFVFFFLFVLMLYVFKGLKGEKNFFRGLRVFVYRYLFFFIIFFFVVFIYVVLKDVWFEVNVLVVFVMLGVGLFLYVKGIYCGLKVWCFGKIWD